MIEVKPLTQKGINSIANTGFLTVWEGAVRSGKTVCSELAWIIYVMNSDENVFIMSGKTISTLYRNVLGGDFGMIAMLGKAGEYKTDREGNRVLLIKGKKGVKTCYCFGAYDETSFHVLRGITAAGWYADEINLHPRSFLEEALRRTVVSRDRKNMWTLNPDNPHHWIYTDYIDKYEAAELKGFTLWHFTLDDNNAIPPERKEELKQQFSGIFYRRYILGERVIAEGIIYDMLTSENFYEDDERPYQLEMIASRTVAADYGTTNPSHFLDIYDDGETIWVDNEYRWDSKSDESMKLGIGQKTDGQYADALAEFMGGVGMQGVVLDPAAASFAAELRLRGWLVIDADNDVENGIRATANLFNKRIIRVHKTRCPWLIKELGSYSWDEKAAMRGVEKPVKTGDHGCDALRYYIYTLVPSWRTGVDKS